MNERTNIRLQNWDYASVGDYFITISTKEREHYFGEIIDDKMQLSDLHKKFFYTHKHKNSICYFPNNPLNPPLKRGKGGLIFYYFTCSRKSSGLKRENFKIYIENIGTIAYVLWYEIKNHTENVNLGAFTIMPNHIHGIITINSVVVVGKGHALSLQQQREQTAIPSSRFQNIGKNTISSIVGSYKSAVTKYAHRLEYEFNWQSRFYDMGSSNNSFTSRFSYDFRAKENLLNNIGIL